MEDNGQVLSAQNVGREFVRQYYTMLNEAPQFLHRFYSHNSSFVHGGIERPGEESSPSIGQGEIYRKIASLNFKDCHAKICQVDSQPSVEGAVVIQVVGELSNNGQQMRRFMQTFVLAPQSPKKYYLHNDIFRYQDQVFHDDVEDSLSGACNTVGQEEYGYVEEDPQQQQQPQQLSVSADETVVPYYDGGVVEQQQEHHVSNGGDAHYPDDTKSNDASLMVSQQQLSSVAVEAVNHQPDSQSAVELGQPAAAEAEGVEPNCAAAVEPDSTAAGSKSEEAVVESSVKESAATPAPAPTVTEPAAPAQKPTWAAMASRNTSSAAATMVPASAAKPQATIRPEPKSSDQRYTAQNGALPQRPPRAHQQQPQQQQNDVPPVTVTANDSTENGVNEEERGVKSAQQQQVTHVYPDTQQLFVGNVPHFVTDDDLREYFEVYGPVADIRINRKANTNVPNYGFVAFESADTVQKILENLPLPKLHNRHRINVEEKKPRDELGRPRSGTRLINPQGQGGGKVFSRDSYSPRGRGGYNNSNGGRGGPVNNGGGGYGSGGFGQGQGGYERNYTRSCSSDDGRGGGQQQQQR